MKNSLFFALAVFLFSSISNAALVETKYRVISRYVDSSGQIHQLFNTRLYIRYNPEVSASSALAKEDCLMTLGGKGLFQYASNASVESCISNRDYVIAKQEVILKMMERATDFSVFNETVYMGFHHLRIEFENPTSTRPRLENLSIQDKGALLKIRHALRNLFDSKDVTHLVSTKERTVFSLSSDADGKFTIEIEPMSTENL